jgi:hypothetical protein
MHVVVILFFLSFIISCKVNSNSKEERDSILQNMSLHFKRNNKLTIAGTAVKGIIKNAIVKSSLYTITASGGASENSNWILYPNTQYRRGDGTSTVDNVSFAQGASNTNGSISFNSTGCNGGARELYCVEQ